MIFQKSKFNKIGKTKAPLRGLGQTERWGMPQSTSSLRHTRTHSQALYHRPVGKVNSRPPSVMKRRGGACSLFAAFRLLKYEVLIPQEIPEKSACDADESADIRPKIGGNHGWATEAVYDE